MKMTNDEVGVVICQVNSGICKKKASKPPNTKQERKVATSTKVQSRKLVSLRASDQAKIFTAVGTPMTRVVYEK